MNETYFEPQRRKGRKDIRYIASRSSRLCGLIIFVFLLTLPVFAQDALDDGMVTADEVNRVAQRLYCPVCPNERLDACQTEACVSWRDDIRRQLEAGQTEEQIVASFVARYGERAAGTPQDPTLRALSLVTPYVIALVALALGAMTFLRWRRHALPVGTAANTPAPTPDDPYRSVLERDLEEK